MSAAAVKAAAAQAHLNGVRGESQALELAVQTARASLPDEDAAAATADAAAAQAAAAVATVRELACVSAVYPVAS